ncbi:MAG: hypothetical protein U0K26_09155 [Prevotella pectinovora]|uniref:hypothetical protein n=1 Tax=Prevotella pectinovora TaxID=1602169 RepID=UPI002E778541|nr:hypothetical protein [Prevotella pectinovora]MEE1547390.1 hypothetical protein [Prevotella pectinovora]
MKNLQTGTTCLSRTTGSKQHKCERSLLRLATFVILFLCSMTVSWAQEPFEFTQNGKKDLVHKSDEESITATFSSTGLSFQREYVKFARNDTGTLTIDANAATISNVSLLVSNSTTKSTATSIPVKPGDKKVSITDREMPVDWSTDNKKVIFKCSTTGDLYVFGATITYKYDDAGKLSLNEVSDPTITLNSTTTTEKLSFTINQTAKTQTGTSLETYYTTDGSNPNDTENKSRVKLTQNPQTVTIDWVKGNTVTVRTFTKRVDDSDAKNYRESAEARQEFTNTGSTDLASVDAPVITPGGEAVVAKSLKVTISDKQWKEGNNLKVYYAIEEGSYGNITTSDWTEATSLPQELTLIKTSTVKAYAKYTASDGTETSSDIVSCTYFLLDDATTYLNTATSQNVGTTVGRNGMTMTFGGIKVGSSNFKALSKNDNTDANTLGSIHTVTGNALFVNVDVESELGDGNIGKDNIDGAEYLHCNASTKKLHENTFALPAMGSFFKFEPEANGKLTVFVEQQGAIHNVGGKLYPEKVRKRPVYFLDETGKSIPANYAYTSSKVNKADWTKIQNTDNASNDNFYTKEYMDKLEKYYQNIIDGNNQNFTNFNSAVADADKRKALTLGTSIQPIIVLHEECNADILKGDGMSETGDTNYDHTGYMLISEGYVTYEFPVKAGKTYYLFASRTKLALSGFCFDKDATYDTNVTPVTLDGNANNTDAINELEVGKQYNVTLKNRTFGANKWYAVVLPFSVSQKQLKSVFGNDVKVLHYSDVEGTDLNLFEHFYQMIVGGTPVLVKPSQEVTNPVFNNVTLTSQKVVDIENTGFKCTGSWDNVDFPEYSYFIDAKDNTFYLYDPTKVAQGTKAPHAGAFRSWIISTSTNPSEAKQLTMHINGIEEQGETTAIWNAISGNDDAEVASKGIYSLSGQKMNATDTRSLPKGIYIVNGKKFIVK